ncbi:MAG: bifunctional methylenetetrahydrofolate dehydrogenase/methenyltetrahydrofolate cyclohydrolase [Bdellovibrionales bacterium RIFCSPHIGHO2_01_FULL_40_29]|nr:MAG: bifunctional methylenetetrahydrofolate dehydrogenase/methenyltetrahydrofolate cyclohydrolase [Bdellovibrionales bacterium RIFCSPHIGHO2_01_FULL_40_29]OFZ35554.1 MAG: bifunctional methylenetetrahydrofolate dehydrogenase/methenyltetrahydrofolate cyclohydrolase [Bdellovibrionales bacterium RIFCSPHIGHO2_02_FULL_40_15]
MIELKGKPVAEAVYSDINKQLSTWSEKKWNSPHLAVVLVGDDPASSVYVSHKQKACERLNFKSTLICLPATASEAEVAGALQKLNLDSGVDAVLLQLPLPKHLDEKKLTEIIDPKKDADGLTQASLGALMAGQQKVASCTPAGIIEMMDHYKIQLTGKKVVVLGRSLIVGLPLFHLLIQKNATVTVCHSKTENLSNLIAQADIVFVAIGKAEFFKPTDFKKDAVVIDVGIHRRPEGLCGDVSSENAEGWLSARAPVPGGVGPMTIAMLMKNTMTLAQLHRQN